MKVLVTGSKGFIGKNLLFKLISKKNIKYMNLIEEIA